MHNQGAISGQRNTNLISGADALWLENVSKGNPILVFNPNGSTQNYVIENVLSDTELQVTTTTISLIRVT